MLDTPANRTRTGAKVLDYAALGMHILASDVPAYRGSIADGIAGQLLPNKPEAWYTALNWAIRDKAMLQAGFDRAREALLSQGTLATQKELRRTALDRAIARTRTTVPA
jgi:glycosyltransferase involved in cell wall biosynthesis